MFKQAILVQVASSHHISGFSWVTNTVVGSCSDCVNLGPPGHCFSGPNFLPATPVKCKGSWGSEGEGRSLPRGSRGPSHVPVSGLSIMSDKSDGKGRRTPWFPADGTLTPLVLIRSRSSGGSTGLGREEGSWALSLLAWLLEAAGHRGLPVACAPNLVLGYAGWGERREVGGLADPM